VKGPPQPLGDTRRGEREREREGKRERERVEGAKDRKGNRCVGVIPVVEKNESRKERKSRVIFQDDVCVCLRARVATTGRESSSQATPKSYKGYSERRTYATAATPALQHGMRAGPTGTCWVKPGNVLTHGVKIALKTAINLSAKLCLNRQSSLEHR